jgi:hypothetical protein
MTKNVYQLIAGVSAEIAKQGISKDRNNTQQGYKFRGIDDVYNALAPVMASAGLVILPRILSRTQTERTTPKGGVLFFVTVEAEFDFVSSHDGSKHTIRTFGEAMDSGDKATNKAMSAAYKYAALQTFCIPTEGDNDADAHHYQTAPAPRDTYEDFEAEHLPAMREAALAGSAALSAAFAKMPKSIHKTVFWQTHQVTLKEAAKKADAQ